MLERIKKSMIDCENHGVQATNNSCCPKCPQKEIARVCQSCYRGRLDIMTTEEKEKAGLDVDTTYYGCDECKHYEESDL